MLTSPAFGEHLGYRTPGAQLRAKSASRASAGEGERLDQLDDLVDVSQRHRLTFEYVRPLPGLAQFENQSAG